MAMKKGYGNKGGGGRFHSTDQAGSDSRGTKYSQKKGSGSPVTEVTNPGQDDLMGVSKG